MEHTRTYELFIRKADQKYLVTCATFVQPNLIKIEEKMPFGYSGPPTILVFLNTETFGILF